MRIRTSNKTAKAILVIGFILDGMEIYLFSIYCKYLTISELATTIARFGHYTNWIPQMTFVHYNCTCVNFYVSKDP